MIEQAEPWGDVSDQKDFLQAHVDSGYDKSKIIVGEPTDCPYTWTSLSDVIWTVLQNGGAE